MTALCLSSRAAYPGSSVCIPHTGVLLNTQRMLGHTSRLCAVLCSILRSGSVSGICLSSSLSMHGQVDAKYSVQFEDNTYAEGYAPPLPVPQRFVIPSKETRKARS